MKIIKRPYKDDISVKIKFRGNGATTYDGENVVIESISIRVWKGIKSTWPIVLLISMEAYRFTFFSGIYCGVFGTIAFKIFMKEINRETVVGDAPIA